MRRGEIWTTSGSGDYYGKPRPVVIIQADAFDHLNSITVCGFATDPADAPLLRLPIQPNRRNGLVKPSWPMIDKITTVRKGRMGQQVGVIDDKNMARINRAAILFLGLATSPDAWR